MYNQNTFSIKPLIRYKKMIFQPLCFQNASNKCWFG